MLVKYKMFFFILDVVDIFDILKKIYDAFAGEMREVECESEVSGIKYSNFQKVC